MDIEGVRRAPNGREESRGWRVNAVGGGARRDRGRRLRRDTLTSGRRLVRASRREHRWRAVVSYVELYLVPLPSSGVLQGGGTAAEAALAAQAFGTPADGGESGDESDSAQASADDEEDDDDYEVDAAELAAAELSVSGDGAGPSAGATEGGGSVKPG